MAQGLQLSQRLTQSLVLAPQLQQSLALLQAPTLDLKALVEQEQLLEQALRAAKPEPARLRVATTAPVPVVAASALAAEPAGQPLLAQAKLIVRIAGDGQEAAAAISECKRLLARSGLVVSLRRRSALIQGKWDAVAEAVRECCQIVARTGDARILTVIKPVGIGAVETLSAEPAGAEPVEESVELQAPVAISLTGQRLHTSEAKTKRHRMSVA